MLDKMIQASTNYLLKKQAIAPEDRDVYEYGFHALYNNILDITSILIISLCLRQMPQTVLYHLAFIPLRHVAGGFHSKTHLRCFLVSTSIWVASLWGIVQTSCPAVCIGLAGLSAMLIWLKAPVEHKNSPLSDRKKKQMKKLGRIMETSFFVLVTVLSLCLDAKHLWIAASLAYGMASHALLLLAAIIQGENKGHFTE